MSPWRVLVKTYDSQKILTNESFLNQTAKDSICTKYLVFISSRVFLREELHLLIWCEGQPSQPFQTFHRLEELLQSLTFSKESNTFKSFIVYPLRTSYFPVHMTVDTTIINHHILGVIKSHSEKSTVWETVLNMKYGRSKDSILISHFAFKEQCW